MGLFDFVKDAGKNVFGGDEPVVKKEETAAAVEGAPSIDAVRARALENHVRKTEIPVDDLDISVDGETVVVSGSVARQEDREKILLALGNVSGVGMVDDRIEVEAEEPEATMYTVESGDTLSKIAKAHYGDASEYTVIFEANRSLLEDPDRIFPGQVLRLPPLDVSGSEG